MRDLLRRLPLELAVGLLIVATILLVALGSNWSPGVRSIAGPLRWVALLALCGTAVAWAYAQPRRAPPLLAPALAGAFVTVALVSALWSADPRLSVGRGVAFAVLIVTAGALAAAVTASGEAARWVLLALVGGAVLVALAGLAVLAVNPGAAVQDATAQIPARFRGVGQNPNTAALLFAAALPVSVAFALREQGRARWVAAGATALLAGSIVASGSRAALVAGFAAALVPALAAARSPRTRAGAVAATGAALVGAVALTQIPQPLSPDDPRAQKSASNYPRKCTPNDAECHYRLEDEFGRPTGYTKPRERGLLGSSGRLDAWRGAIDQGAERPLLGYGFGTENRVFVDRYHDFQGGSPENSFIGVFLQVGVLGAALFGGLLVTLVVAGARALARLDGDRRLLAAGSLAALLVGLGLATTQSFLYSAGNTATLTVWTCGLLVTSLAAAPARR